MAEEIKVEVDDQKKPQDQPSDITVEFDDKGQPVKKEDAKKPEGSSTAENLQNFQKELDKKLNAQFYNQRKLEQQIQEIHQKIQPAPAAAPAKPAAPVDEWDQKVQKNWRGTVEELADLRAEAKFNELMQKQAETAKQNARQDQENKIREDSKLKALTKHPELTDDSTEKAQIYRQILAENQDYLTNPRGPVLAMNDMEERLRSAGRFVDDSTKKIVDKEVLRQTRATAGQAPAGGKAKANVVVLSKEEKEFCDNHNLKYESYAKSKRMVGQKEGVEA